MPTKENKKPGPPPWIPTGEEIEKAKALASRACTLQEIAAALEKSHGLIQKEIGRNPIFKQAIEDGRMLGVVSIKRKQYELAMAGDKTMLIWWGKNYCDQNPDKPPTIPPSDNPLLKFITHSRPVVPQPMPGTRRQSN